MRLDRIWAVFLVNVRTLVRDKGGLFFTFLFPVMLMLLFGFIFQGSGELNIDIYVQDLDGSESSNELVAWMKEINGTHVHMISPDKDVGRVMEDKNLDLVVIIPEDYNETIMRRVQGDMNATVNITVMYDPSLTSSSVKLSLLNGLLQELNKGIGGVTDTVFIVTDNIVSEDMSYIEYFIPGVIGMTVMSGAVYGTIFGDTELKQKGIFRKLSTTPITRGEWLLSNMLFQLFLAGLSAGVILLVGYVVFGASLKMNPIAALVVIFEAFAFTGLAMILVRFIKEAQSASAVGNVITFPMMFLSGTFFQVDSMPAALQFFAKLLPLYYVNVALREAMIFNDTGEAFTNMLVIAVFAVIVFVLGVAFTTWKHD